MARVSEEIRMIEVLNSLSKGFNSESEYIIYKNKVISHNLYEPNPGAYCIEMRDGSPVLPFLNNTVSYLVRGGELYKIMNSVPKSEQYFVPISNMIKDYNDNPLYVFRCSREFINESTERYFKPYINFMYLTGIADEPKYITPEIDITNTVLSLETGQIVDINVGEEIIPISKPLIKFNVKKDDMITLSTHKLPYENSFVALIKVYRGPYVITHFYRMVCIRFKN